MGSKGRRNQKRAAVKDSAVAPRRGDGETAAQPDRDSGAGGVGRRSEAPAPGASAADDGPSRTPIAFASGSTDVPLPRPDDTNVPPAEDLDAAFFQSQRASEPVWDAHPPDPRVTRVMTEAAVRRRAHLAKYVKTAVGLASALCIVALVKATLTPGNSQPNASRSWPATASAPVPARAAASPSAMATATETAPTRAESSATAEPAASAEPVANAEPVASAEPAAEAVPDSVDAATSAVPAPSSAAVAASEASQRAGLAAVESPAREPEGPEQEYALRAKKQAQSALERGLVSTAVEAGERSVALDAGDAETWLILGAAYQQLGNLKEARRCYRSCVSAAARGPKAECAAMLR